VPELTTTTPTDVLLARLDDPEVAAALLTLLDNADVLALVVQSLDGLLRRADVISSSVESGLGDVRALADSARFLVEPTRKLAEKAPGIADAATALLDSGMLNREVVSLLGQFAAALLTGREAARRNRTTVSGIRGTLHVLRDPEVARGLGLLVEVARALGRDL
jgi:uncharacterized protein YjgD (DUF1641 family)